MALRITRAADHKLTGLAETRYCSFQDVLDEVVKTEVGDDHQPLSNLLDMRTLERKVEGYLVNARLWVEAEDQAGRDFEKHEHVTVYLDGSGRDSLDLAAFGFTPLLDLEALSVDGWSLALHQDFTATSRGILRRVTGPPSSFPGGGRLGSPLFAAGTQNVVATLTWGYDTYPRDLVRAQAMRVVADLLRFVDRSDSESGEIPGGVSQIRFGNDLVVNTGSAGRYAKAIADLERQARETCWRHRTCHVAGPRPS